MTDGPLRGIRILDLTHVWAGPLATRTLADLGAAVVKVEAPYGRGPRAVSVAPIGGWIGGEVPVEPWNANAIFVKLQRNKQSVAIDLKAQSGREVFLELVAVSDVVMENFSARAMPSLGLDYPTLAKANPRIVYLTMPGYGSSGPFRDRVAFGPTVEPMSGLTHVMGYGPDEPRNTAMALPDPIAAMHATAAVLTALRRRDASGEGALVEMSLHESATSLWGPWLVEQQLGGTIERIGNRHPAMAPHGVYRTAGDDAWVAVACRDNSDWRALAALVGAGLDGALDFAGRRRAEVQIDAAIERWTIRRDKLLAAQELQAAGLPAGPVNATPDMAADPQVRARGFFVPLDGGTPMPGNPIHMSGLDSATWTPCPKLGADNEVVLSDWLGYSADQVARLEQSGVLVSEPPE